jgi:tRNA(Ile)-lysidine synthase
VWMTAAARPFRAARTGPSDGTLPVALELTALAAAPLALRRMLVRDAMTEAAGGRSISYDHVAAALRLMDSEGRGFDAPGQRVERVGDRLVFTSRPAGTVGRWLPSTSSNLFEYPLSIPGEVMLPEAGCAISAEPACAEGRAPTSATVGKGAAALGHDVALVRGDLCKGPLAVRNRRPGDHFRPAGGGRRKKLQDFFVDTKVARSGRDAVPIVVDEQGRIVWVAGHAIDAAFRVTDPAQGVLILRLRRV